MANHIMCIGWPTIKRLAAGESVWFEDLQCGAVAADDLHGADVEGMIAARIGEYDERIWLERVGKAEAEVERLRDALEEYGQHANRCDYDRPADPRCTCGFAEVLALTLEG